MQEKVTKIIEFLLQEMSQVVDAPSIDLESLSEQLKQKGFTEGEIHQAFEWVIMNVNDQKVTAHLADKKPLALRLLMPEELEYFSGDAYGYLIQLQTLGIISPLQMEQMVERCFLLGFNKATLKEVKTVVSQILLGKEVGTFQTDAVYHPGNDKLN